MNTAKGNAIMLLSCLAIIAITFSSIAYMLMNP